MKTHDKDMKMLLTKLIDVCEYLNHKYNVSLDNYQFYDEDEYNFKDDNGNYTICLFILINFRIGAYLFKSRSRVESK
jgi:hypothetical protein